MGQGPFSSGVQKIMRSAAFVLLALAIACEAFAWWGLGTVPGRQAFDEMAGMIPYAAAALGALFALASAFAWWRSRCATRLRKPERP